MYVQWKLHCLAGASKNDLSIGSMQQRKACNMVQRARLQVHAPRRCARAEVRGSTLVMSRRPALSRWLAQRAQIAAPKWTTRLLGGGLLACALS